MKADVERLARYFAQRYGGDDSLLEARKALDPEVGRMGKDLKGEGTFKLQTMDFQKSTKNFTWLYCVGVLSPDLFGV